MGPPALLQVIGDILVGYAIDLTVVHTLLEEDVLVQGQGVFDVFWNQFCAEQCVKDTLICLIEQQGETAPDSLCYLLQHRFIEKADGRFRVRVPLFERWVRNFHIDFLKL